MSTQRDWIAQPQMSDDAVRRATGRDWEAWTKLLDAWGGRDRTHTEIARHVAEAHDIDGWWAQSVTVGYERIRGLRRANERPDGFSMNASKTLPVPVDELFLWFVDETKRQAWLGGDVLRVRTAQPPRSARFDEVEDGGILAAHFTDKGEKSAVQVQVNGIATEAGLVERKALWKSRLNDLAERVKRSLA